MPPMSGASFSFSRSSTAPYSGLPGPSKMASRCWSSSRWLLWKGILAMGGPGLPQAPAGSQPVGTKVGEDVLNSPESIGPWFDLQTDFTARLDKLLLDVTRHEARLLGIDIGALEAGEGPVRAG